MKTVEQKHSATRMCFGKFWIFSLQLQVDILVHIVHLGTAAGHTKTSFTVDIIE